MGTALACVRERVFPRVCPSVCACAYACALVRERERGHRSVRVRERTCVCVSRCVRVHVCVRVWVYDGCRCINY